MSDFWAEKLGAQQRIQVPQQYVPSSRPWWDERPLPPQPQPQQTVSGQPQQYQAGEYAPRQARSAKQTQLCPECGSNSYLSVAAEGVSSSVVGPARAHCFGCGYPYIQAGSGGLGHTSKDSKATPSRQIHDGSSQVYTQVIAHIE